MDLKSSSTERSERSTMGPHEGADSAPQVATLPTVQTWFQHETSAMLTN